MFAYLTEQNIFQRYRDSKKYTDSLTDQFPEFERIARNKPHPLIDPAYPKTTDGTTASIIRKTPRRVIQQIPTGSVISDSDDWLTHVANFIYNKKILPYAKEEYDLIQKCWSAVEKSLTYGAYPSYAPFLNHDGYFCPDMTLPHWGDIFLQRGKRSGYACNFVFMRSWWQKEDLQAIIDEQNNLKKKSKSYEPTWDVENLQKILDAEQTKDEKAETASERERNREVVAGIQLVTGFQKGVGAKFFTFHPSEELIVRTKANKDPRGKMPIDWIYGDTDGSNPWGRGIVELVGPLQNLIDADMQMYQFNRALMLAPPVIKKGTFNRSKIRYVPNQIIDVGNDQQADIIPLKIDTTAISNYPALYGLQKSQLLNLTNSPDTSISSDVGNPNFSKTPQGVQAQAAVISVDDNYVRKMFEAWFEKWSETAINLYFAERTGIEELQLDNETTEKLKQLPNFDQSLINDENKIRINYDLETPALNFRVNPSTTQVKDNAAQVQDAQNLLDMVMKYPMLNKLFGGPVDTKVLARRIVINSGIENPEQVAPEPTPAEIESEELQRQQVNPFSPFFDKPHISIDWAQLPPTAQLDLLRNAGSTNVTIQDILQGPVVNPNTRGNMDLAPMSDPSALLPGQQPGEVATAAPSPIDLGDIYKGTTDPTVKAQIEKLAGVQPDLGHVVNQINTNDAQHAASQAQALTPPQAVQKPETKQQEASEPQPNNEDAELVQALQQAGAKPDQIQRALAMLHSGKYDENQILAMLVQGAK